MLLAAAGALIAQCGWTQPLNVTVLDARQRPVTDAVIVLSAETAIARPAAEAPARAVMDQVNKAFVPLVLVVRTGTSVVFPNSDTIAHQVYSFSSPKRFKLGLYRGHSHPPVRFDTPGLIVLGCNIHDRMVGYIFVTDAAYFGKSDAQGRFATELPVGRYRISVWMPQTTREVVQFEQDIVVTDSGSQRLDVSLARASPASRAGEPDPRVREY
jgi:plastocyanin